MGFSPASGGASAMFRPEEATILIDLTRQLADLVEHRGAHGTDPAIDRLLPDAYSDSVENAAEFRRFTEGDLADMKVRNALFVAESLTAPARRRGIPVELDDAGIQAWLRTLTDLRLTLADRIGIDPEGATPFDADPATVAVYEWLGFLLETLVRAIDR